MWIGQKERKTLDVSLYSLFSVVCFRYPIAHCGDCYEFHTFFPSLLLNRYLRHLRGLKISFQQLNTFIHIYMEIFRIAILNFLCRSMPRIYLCKTQNTCVLTISVFILLLTLGSFFVFLLAFLDKI